MNNITRRLSAILAAALVPLTVAPTALADMHGYDVSGWQPSTVTCAVSGDFAVVKATGGLGFTNPYWRTQADCTLKTGKKLGLYHYAGDGTSGTATAEADRFVAAVTPYLKRALLALDWEKTGNAHWGDGNWIRTFVNRVHARTGVWPLVYVSAAFVSQVPSDVRRNCGLWVAQYATSAATGYQVTPWRIGTYAEAMRQYTSNGRLSGYAGPLDLNLFRGDAAAWDAYADPSKAKPSTPSQPAQTPTQPTQPTQPTRTLSVTIRYGDTIWGLASRYNAWPLSAWSVPSGNIGVIYPGQTATYRGATTATTPTVRRHTVRAGETLGSIAAANGISYTAIRGYRSGNPNLIYPGEVVYW